MRVGRGIFRALTHDHDSRRIVTCAETPRAAASRRPFRKTRQPARRNPRRVLTRPPASPPRLPQPPKHSRRAILPGRFLVGQFVCHRGSLRGPFALPKSAGSHCFAMSGFCKETGMSLTSNDLGTTLGATVEVLRARLLLCVFLIASFPPPPLPPPRPRARAPPPRHRLAYSPSSSAASLPPSCSHTDLPPSAPSCHPLPARAARFVCAWALLGNRAAEMRAKELCILDIRCQKDRSPAKLKDPEAHGPARAVRPVCREVRGGDARLLR